MAKISKEEYKLLKGLDDQWKWIARDEDLSVYDDKPVKVHSVIPCWDISTAKNEWQRINRSLFQFIQWSDPEPYNIAELIREYEGEETEVKRDLKEAILGIEVTQFDGQRADLEELVNPRQLEKIIGDWMPEVLSQEWIDKHVETTFDLDEDFETEFIKVDDLQNIIVPKQEEVDQAYKDGYEKGKQHTYYKGYLEGLADKESINPERSPEVDRHKELLDELNDLYARKNQDYGNNFDESLDEDGLLVLKIRLGDKFKRFSQLINNEQMVNDESMRDTLIDLANYALMGVMWMDKNGEKEDDHNNFYYR